MYKCEKCGKITCPGEKLNKKVISTREVEYLNQVKDKKNKRSNKLYDKVTHGIEIVKEINLCNNCAGVKNQPRLDNIEFKNNYKNEENKIVYSTDKGKKGNYPFKDFKYILNNKEN